MVLTPHEFSSRFWTVIAATFLGFLGIGTVMPGLAPHVRHDLGGSDRTVGFVIGIFSVVALASRFLSGPLADRRGRKITFLLGLGCCSAAGLVYLLPLGLGSAYAGRILQGFGEACLYTGAAAWVVELGGLQRSGQSLGYLSGGIWGGISAGPVVGHWLGSFANAALFQCLSALAAMALLSFVEEHYKPEEHRRAADWKPQGFWQAGLSVGFVNVHYPVMAGFAILHLASHGNSGPAAFSAYAAVILTSRLFLGGLPDRLPPRALFFGGLGCMGTGLVLLAMGPRPAVAVFAAGLLGFGFSFPWSCVATTILRRTAPGDRGSVIGGLSAFYDAFVGGGSFAAGFLSHRFGYPSAFVMGAVCLLFAAAIANSLFVEESGGYGAGQALGPVPVSEEVS
jgi:MFS family permease